MASVGRSLDTPHYTKHATPFPSFVCYYYYYYYPPISLPLVPASPLSFYSNHNNYTSSLSSPPSPFFPFAIFSTFHCFVGHFCLFSMILSMPKVEKVPSSRRDSNTIAAAAGGGTRTAPWSQKDDETLMAARTQGLNWNQIAPKYFPTKTSNACRKRHERLMEKQNAEQWDGVKLDELAQAYMEVRREMWSILASRVNEKWALVEQKVCLERVSA